MFKYILCGAALYCSVMLPIKYFDISPVDLNLGILIGAFYASILVVWL